MNRTAILLTVALGLGLGGWLWLESPTDVRGGAAAVKPNATESSRSSAAQLASPLSEPLAADSRVAPSETRSQTAAPPPPPEPQGLEDGGDAPAPDLDFGSRYSGWSEGQMRERLTAIDGELQLALDAEFLPRIERGQFTEHAVSRDERRSVAELLAEHGAGDPLCRVWPVFDIAGAGAATSEQRLIAVRVICLARTEFERLAQLADEQRWLRARVAGGG